MSDLTKFGIRQVTICRLLGIDENTLYKYYKHEIDTATENMVCEVATSLYEKAVVHKDVASMIFLLKTRGRWRTADNESLLESNDKLRAEMMELRKQLDEKNRKEY